MGRNVAVAGRGGRQLGRQLGRLAAIYDFSLMRCQDISPKGEIRSRQGREGYALAMRPHARLVTMAETIRTLCGAKSPPTTGATGIGKLSGRFTQQAAREAAGKRDQAKEGHAHDD